MKQTLVTTILLSGPPFVGKTTILQRFYEMLQNSQFLEDRELIFGRTRFVDRLFVGPIRIDENRELYHRFFAYGGQDWLSTNRRIVLSKIKPDFLIFVANSQDVNAAGDERLSYKMNQFYWDEMQVIENISERLPQIFKAVVINKMDLPGVVSYQRILSQLKISPSIVVDLDGTIEFPKSMAGEKFTLENEKILELILSTSKAAIFKTIAINGVNVDNLLGFVLTLLGFLVQIKESLEV